MLHWKLKQVLIQKRLSMRQAAKLSGVSYSQIRKLCLNPSQDSKVHTLDKLAEALNVPYEELIGNERR